MQKELKSGQEKYASEKSEIAENAADVPTYPLENVRHNYAVDNGNPQALKLTAAMDGQSVQRASLKEKLEVFKVKAAGSEKQESYKEKGKEVTM